MKSASVIAFVTLAALGMLVVLPMGFVVLQAIFPELGAGSFQQPFGAVISTFSDPATLTLIGSTVVTGIGVALVAACLGIPLGALRAQFQLPLAGVWDLLFLIPFLLPPYIAALSWILALQPGGYTQQLFGFNLGALLFSRTGMILVMGLSAFPIVYFAVSRSMMAAGTRLAEAARVFGASPWRAFVQVTLPLALPAVAASLLLAFTLAIEEYGVPAALGSQAGVSMLTTAIERRLADWPIDPPGAALLSLVLVCLAMTAYLTQRALVAGRDYETTTGKAAASHQAALGLWYVPVMLFFGLTALVAVGWPIASMLAASLSGTVSGGLSISNLSLGNFAALFDMSNEALQALGTSVSLAAATAVLAGGVGFLAAWSVTKGRVPGAGLIDACSLLPAALPGVVVGVGLILAWNQPFWPVTPYGTWLILLLSYTCLLLPYPVRYVGAAFRQISDSLEAAARVHGASLLRTLWHVSLPLSLPSLIAAMLMVFAVASRELVTSLLLAPAGVQTVSIFIWRQFEQGSIGQGMAMATVAIVISLGLMLGGLALQRRGV
ncbi:MAG: iron ABC transporter permease [Pusillimonas sp.]